MAVERLAVLGLLELTIVQTRLRFVAGACLASLVVASVAPTGLAESSHAPAAPTAPRAPATKADAVVRDLNIAPEMQQTSVWCWLAVGEMIFRHYGVPQTPHSQSYQCGIVQSISIATNMTMCAADCSGCIVPAEGTRDFVGMLADYPRRAAVLAGKPAPRIFASVTGVLTPSEVRGEIDANHPMVAGINPDGRPAVMFEAPEHVVLIVGYAGAGSAVRLRVNDPFPYQPAQNPYLRAGATMLRPGSYEIAYDVFERSLAWRDSYLVRALGRHEPGDVGPTMPPSIALTCATPAGRCPLLAPAAPGAPCACPNPLGGAVSGTAS